MRFLLSFILFCVTQLSFAAPLQDRSLKIDAVKELVEQLGLDPNGDLVAQTQAKWLRGSGQERWDIQELSIENRERVLYWAESQHVFSECVPVDKEYDKALILGATTGRMEKRLDYLAQSWNRGVRFKEVVWLTGDRPLNTDAEALLDGCQNESEAARYIWEHAEIPQEMKQLPVVFVAVPMKSNGKRPNTQDTLVAWLEVSSEPCKALFVSDQPFCGYQFAIINTTLPDSYSFDIIGPAVNPFSHPAAASITLDTIARQLYQESLSNRVVLK